MSLGVSDGLSILISPGEETLKAVGGLVAVAMGSVYMERNRKRFHSQDLCITHNP